MNHPKRKRNYRREAALETIRYIQDVENGLFQIMSDEVRVDEDRNRLFHFRRGMDFVIGKLRQRL